MLLLLTCKKIMVVRGLTVFLNQMALMK